MESGRGDPHSVALSNSVTPLFPHGCWNPTAQLGWIRNNRHWLPTIWGRGVQDPVSGGAAVSSRGWGGTGALQGLPPKGSDQSHQGGPSWPHHPQRPLLLTPSPWGWGFNTRVGLSCVSNTNVQPRATPYGKQMQLRVRIRELPKYRGLLGSFPGSWQVTAGTPRPGVEQGPFTVTHPRERRRNNMEQIHFSWRVHQAASPGDRLPV